MRIVLSWVREFCPAKLGAEELAELLTSRGAKVEAIERPWERLSGVVVARVMEVRDHPGSDKLCLARVTTGATERQVVVGVRNMAPGDLVPLAGLGATLPSLQEPLAARRIRGVVSDGMLCSPYELGINANHEAILVLPPDLSPGEEVLGALGLDDAVLDIEVTPNRPDFLSVIGVAREVAAATGAPFTSPDTSVEEDDEKAEEVATLEVLDRERCPRYLARVVRGIRHVDAPLRVQARLTASGMRPISAAVDATNYSMLEIGQPLHPFDLGLLGGPGILVRRAAAGERLVTLDDVERAFTEDDLLICDTERPVAVAGVMGGAVAEMSESTTDVLLESAHFERGGIQRTRRRVDLSTEASMRFERGTDPEAVPTGADRACRLMAEWSGARVLSGALEVGAAPERRRIAMRPSRATMLLGYPVSAVDTKEAFDRLAMANDVARDSVVVEVPGYRVDVEREVDLIEEFVRVQGYDRVRSTLPAVRQAGGLPATYAFAGLVRRALARAGLREVRLPSFASGEDVAMFGDEGAVGIANPLDAAEDRLRGRLLPGLLRAVGRNRSRQVRSVAIFEVGTVFRRADPVAERLQVGLAMSGPAELSWVERERPFDFFDAKGALEALLSDVGVRDWSLGGLHGGPFHPGRAAAVLLGGDPVGLVAELHPAMAEDLALSGRVAIAELELAALMAHASFDLVAQEPSRFPPVRRDLAFLVNETVPAGAFREALLAAGAELVDACFLFDVFTGGQLPAGKKSLAFSLDLRATDRTLTDDEAEAAIARMVGRVASDFGAELRAG